MNSERINLAIKSAKLRFYNLEPKLETKVVEYVTANADYMHEMTSDMVSKVAELALLCPEKDEWMRAADMVVLSYKGRIEKMLNE